MLMRRRDKCNFDKQSAFETRNFYHLKTTFNLFIKYILKFMISCLKKKVYTKMLRLLSNGRYKPRSKQ